MVIFHSYVSLPESICYGIWHIIALSHSPSWLFSDTATYGAPPPAHCWLGLDVNFVALPRRSDPHAPTPPFQSSRKRMPQRPAVSSDWENTEWEKYEIHDVPVIVHGFYDVPMIFPL